MRTRRFRPSVGFRPGFDLLLPRITPSDISLMVYTNPTPVADSVTTNTTPPPTTPAPTNTSTTDPDDTGGSSTTTPAVGC